MEEDWANDPNAYNDTDVEMQQAEVEQAVPKTQPQRAGPGAAPELHQHDPARDGVATTPAWAPTQAAINKRGKPGIHTAPPVRQTHAKPTEAKPNAARQGVTAAGPANPAPATTPQDLDPSQTPVILAAVFRTEAPRQESSNLSAPQPAAPASQLSASSDAATLTAHSARRRNAGVKVKSWKMSVQPHSRRGRARRGKCQYDFQEGDLRIAPVRSGGATFHIGCLDHDLPDMNLLKGGETLSASQNKVLSKPCCRPFAKNMLPCDLCTRTPKPRRSP